MRQQNIVLRNNVARWPRQHGGKAGSDGTSARSFPDCDCSDVPRGNQKDQTNGSCFSHACYATYASGAGVQFLNNRCEGANLFLQFNGRYPNTAGTQWCGPLAVAGNSYAEMPGQGSGCMVDGATNGTNSFGQDFWCNKAAPPWSPTNYSAAPTVGGQCGRAEKLLPPPCEAGERFAACRRAPGVGGACFRGSGPVACLTAAELAQGGPRACAGGGSQCTFV